VINYFLIHTFPLFVLAFVMSAVLTGIVLIVLRRRAIFDLPNARSSHRIPTPRGGGWGLMLALAPLWVWSVWRAGLILDPTEIALMAGAIILMGVSWIDDRHGLGAGIRFVAQFVAVGAVLATLPRDLSLSDGFLPLPIDRIVAILAWMWFVNLFNFMDGIDGITGGTAAAMGLGLMLVWLRHGPDQLEAFRGAVIAAVALGFLCWNWQPAKIFLGDVGSIPLGYLLGYELVRLAMDAGQVFALIIALYYLADATITLLKRARRGERVWQAHREHYYQRSTQSGRSHGHTAGIAVLCEFGLALLAWLATLIGWWLLIPAVALVLFLLRWMSRPPGSAV